MLLTTQYLDEADQLADRIAVIDRGRVVAEGTPDELKSSVGTSSLQLRIGGRDGGAVLGSDLETASRAIQRVLGVTAAPSPEGTRLTAPMADADRVADHSSRRRAPAIRPRTGLGPPRRNASARSGIEGSDQMSVRR